MFSPVIIILVSHTLCLHLEREEIIKIKVERECDFEMNNVGALNS